MAAINRYTKPREYQAYTPTSVEQYTAPLTAEAQATGAQMQVLGAMDTKFDGLAVDEKYLEKDISGVEDTKKGLVDQIMSGDGASGTDLYDAVTQYNDLYGTSGKVTKAKTAYADYAKEVAYYKKNADKFDPNAVAHYTKKALAEYESDRSGGFTMNTVAQIQDVQGEANKLTKLASDNNTVTTSSLSEANLVQIFDTGGKPTGRYRQIGTDVTMTQAEAYSIANVSAIKNSINGNPKYQAYIRQQAEMRGVEYDDMLNSYIQNGYQLNSQNKVKQSEKEFNVKNIKPGGTFAGYGSGNNEWMEVTGQSTAGYGEQRNAEFDVMVDNSSKLLRNSIESKSSKSYMIAIGDVQTALKTGNTSKIVAMAKDSGVPVDENRTNDAKYMSTVASQTMGKLNQHAKNSTDVSNVGKDIIIKAKDDFFSKPANKQDKIDYDRYNGDWDGVPEGIKVRVKDYYEQSTGAKLLPFSDSISEVIDAAIKAEGIDTNDTSFGSEYDNIVSKVAMNTRWVAYEGKDKTGINKLNDYFNTNKEKYRNDFKGAPTNNISFKALDAEQTRILKNDQHLGMSKAFASPSGKTVLGKKDEYFGSFEPEEIPWKETTLESIDVPNDVDSVTLNFEYQKQKGDTVYKERITIDPSSEDGEIALRKIVSKMPDGDLKTALIDRMVSKGQGGGMPTRAKQTSGYDKDYEYNVSATGTMEVFHKGEDVTSSYRLSTLGMDLLRDPSINKQVNSFKAQTRDLPVSERNAVFAKGLSDALVKSDANPDGVLEPFQFEILMLSISKASPAEQMISIKSKVGFSTYIADAYAIQSKNNKSYNNYVDITTYIKPKTYGK